MPSSKSLRTPDLLTRPFHSFYVHTFTGIPSHTYSLRSRHSNMESVQESCVLTRRTEIHLSMKAGRPHLILSVLKVTTLYSWTARKTQISPSNPPTASCTTANTAGCSFCPPVSDHFRIRMCLHGAYTQTDKHLYPLSHSQFLKCRWERF